MPLKSGVDRTECFNGLRDWTTNFSGAAASNLNQYSQRYLFELGDYTHC
jgi:hypothetical protein